MLIHVNSSDLKSVFKDIKPIFKGSTDAAIICLLYTSDAADE